MRLDGKIALVTGSTSNIGRGIALAMAREGARVVVSGRDVARGAWVVDQIRSDGGTARFVPPTWTALQRVPEIWPRPRSPHSAESACW
jgi:NAD(P)-dependent dehydrogenase (short-subunit alcohol dehydrogenase family)